MAGLSSVMYFFSILFCHIYTLFVQPSTFWPDVSSCLQLQNKLDKGLSPICCLNISSIWNRTPQTRKFFLWLHQGSAGSYRRRFWFLVLFHGRSPPLCYCVSHCLIMFLDPYSDLWWQQSTELFENENLTKPVLWFCLVTSTCGRVPLVADLPGGLVLLDVKLCGLQSEDFYNDFTVG